jgi:hypothetical protein
VAIFQHSLQFLQSESFQTHVGSIHRRAIGSLAHHNGTSAYSPSLTCHLPAPTIGCLHSNDSQTTLFKSIEVRRQQSRYYGTQLQLVYIVVWKRPFHSYVDMFVSLLRYSMFIFNILTSFRVQSDIGRGRDFLCAEISVTVNLKVVLLFKSLFILKF